MEKKMTYNLNSHNEWDKLKEVIVGRVDGSCLSRWSTINEETVPKGKWAGIYEELTTSSYSPKIREDIIHEGKKALNNLISILKDEGVIVRRPQKINFKHSFNTPDWHIDSGFSSANPRDSMLVIGNEIIEAPMADRSRYFETFAYKDLIVKYFNSGAKWTSAPKPRLLNKQYKNNKEKNEFIINEYEPTFDAADFMRCGKDIFCQYSHVTNKLGVEWLRRHLGSEYRVHIINSNDPNAIHIDTSFIPLRPGKVLINPEYIDIKTLPSILKNWDILLAPEPVLSKGKNYGMLSKWISINILSLDEEKIIVEKDQIPLIKLLEKSGFKPIPCEFTGYYPFAGSFHCATLDTYREGSLNSYF